MKQFLTYGVPFLVLGLAAIAGVSLAQNPVFKAAEPAAVQHETRVSVSSQQLALTEQDMQALAAQLNELEPQVN